MTIMDTANMKSDGFSDEKKEGSSGGMFSGMNKCQLLQDELLTSSDPVDVTNARVTSNSPYVDQTVLASTIQTNANSNEQEVIASILCEDYTYVIDEDNIPCLSYELLDWLDYLVKKDFCDENMARFFEAFGTHVPMKATLGNRIFFQGLASTDLLTSAGLTTDDLVFDKTEGWCNYQDQSTSCNKVKGGKGVSDGFTYVDHVQAWQTYIDPLN